MRKTNGLPAGTMKFVKAPCGGGGMTINGDIASDGTMIAGGDEVGAWKKPAGSDLWVSVQRTTSLPSGSYGPSQPNNSGYADYPGAYTTLIRADDSNTMIMTWNGYVFRTTDGAATWTQLSGGPFKFLTNSGDVRALNRKGAHDPQGPAWMIGPQEGKVIYSTNGTTINTLTVAAGTNINSQAACHLVAVDPSSSVSGGVKQKWVYHVEGTGIYQSTTGPGGTYSLLSGSPANARSIWFDVSGNLWALQAGETTGGNIYKKTPAGTMAKISFPVNKEMAVIAVNPANTSDIVCVGATGGIFRSLDGGSTWFDSVNPYFRQFGTAIPWFNEDRNTLGPSVCDAKFHPTNGDVYMFTGIGPLRVRVAASPTPALTYFYEDAKGIEMLEAAQVCCPPGGDPIFVVHDFGLFIVTDPKSHKGTLHRFPKPSTTFNPGYGVDWAPEDPTFLVATCGGTSNGYSADKGRTWTEFPSHGLDGGGAGRVIPASKDVWVWFPSNNQRAQITLNRGVSWAYLTTSDIPNLPTTGTSGWGYSSLNPHHAFCTDKATGDIYAMNYRTDISGLGGTWKRSFSTGLWSKMGGWPGGVSAEAVAKLWAVPGQPGHFLFKGDNNTPLYRSTNNCQNWTAFTNTANVQAMGVGKAAPGQSYPAIYFYGQLSSVWGLYRSDDGGSTWTFICEYPLNEAAAYGSNIADMFGSLDTYGTLYIADGRQAGFIGTYDFSAKLAA